MKKYPDNLHFAAIAGFSLVDVLVGMVIAMLGIIIIFQVFSVSEGIKRTTTSGGDALQNGAAAQFALERSLKGAGYGIFACTNPLPTPSDPCGTAPVVITSGGAASVSDSITIQYRLDGRATAPAAPAAPCAPVAATGTPNWVFGSFPPASGVGFSSPPALTVETISVIPAGANNQSQLCSNVNGVISEGIVLMKAEYGIDSNLDGIVDSAWTQTAPANVMSALAVRVVMVARSANPEDKDANGNRATGANCTTTTTFPTSTLTTAPTLDLSANVGLAAGDSWKCYRYKTFENTVPLRNVIWRP